jgi:hypothetical protein
LHRKLIFDHFLNRFIEQFYTFIPTTILLQAIETSLQRLRRARSMYLHSGCTAASSESQMHKIIQSKPRLDVKQAPKAAGSPVRRKGAQQGEPQAGSQGLDMSV